MRPLYFVAIIFVTLGMVMAAIPANTTHPYKLEPAQLLELVNSGMQYYSPDEVADMIINADPSFMLIDVRGQDEYEKFHLPGAINIPATDILAEEWVDYLDQDSYNNIFYSNSTVKANEAWMITIQLGYENNYVLQGGLNYWAETIMNPEAPAMTSPDEEIAKYNFRKGAGMELGGGAATAQDTDKPVTSLPKIKPRPKKKRTQGGC